MIGTVKDDSDSVFKPLRAKLPKLLLGLYWGYIPELQDS